MVATSDPAAFAVGINLGEVSQSYFFNKTGELQPIDLGLTLIHEVIHVGLGLHDLSDDGEPFLNRPDIDQRGATLKAQNQVAIDINRPDLVQPSYMAATLPGSPRLAAFKIGKSYTEGRSVGTRSASNWKASAILRR